MMGRRGPTPGTTGRPPAEVAALAAAARARGERVSTAVAAHYGIAPLSAVRAISRARAKGYDIPYDYGYTDHTGTWRPGRKPPGTAGRRSIYPHGTTSRYRQGCRCGRCTYAHAAYYRAYRAAHATPKPPPPAPAPTPGPPSAIGRTTSRHPTVTLACGTCGHTTDTVWNLAGHTLDAHARIPTKAERTPITPKEVAA